MSVSNFYGLCNIRGIDDFVRCNRFDGREVSLGKSPKDGTKQPLVRFPILQ